MYAKLTLAAALALGAAACSSAPDPKGTGNQPGIDAEDKGPASPIDHPPVDPAKILKSAEVRRLTIQQVRLSLPKAFGLDADGAEITWKIGNDKGLDKMSDSLGEADFIDTTEDGLEPSPLYLKFMDDAARDVCNRALTADAAKSDATQRVILRHVEPADTATSNGAAIAANLRYLKLRLHGAKVADGDAATIAPLVDLFTAAALAAAGADAPDEAAVKEGWRAVCVALVVAPEFHVY